MLLQIISIRIRLATKTIYNIIIIIIIII